MVQKRLVSIPICFFDNQNSGQLASRVINDSVLVKNFVTMTIPETITGTITVIGTVFVLFALDWKLALFIILLFPLEAMIAIPLGSFEEKITKKTQQRLSELSGITTEGLRNIRSIKLNVAEKKFLTKFKNNVQKLYKLSVKSDAVYAISGPFQSLVSFILIIFVLLYGGSRVSQGTLTWGTLTSFLIYFYQLIGPVNILASFYTNYKQTKGAIFKIVDILNTPIENYGMNNYQINNLTKPYNLEIKKINFSYSSNIPILKDVSMNFPSKKKIAIVGPSGVGKTTVINIITRLYETQSGQILLNNVDSNKFNLQFWRSLFGVVSQGNTTITGTIFDNLVFGLTKLPTKQQIVEAIDIADLTQDIERLDNKLDSIVGEQGIKLSGGQQQRLQIARAYLKNPSFLILDEATSNLDADSEAKINLSLKKVMKGKTTIVIAHRLSTVVDADNIYFINNKKIVGSGTHTELLKTLPIYKKFVSEQFIKQS